jgi:hypothetical protein
LARLRENWSDGLRKSKAGNSMATQQRQIKELPVLSSRRVPQD